MESELTTRQEDVLVLVADGLSNNEIGAVLGITPRTAKHHVDSLRQRYRCSVKRQLVAVAERELTRRRRNIIRTRINSNRKGEANV